MEIFMWLLFVIIDWLVYFALHQGELKSSLYNIKLFRFNNAIWFTSGYGQDKKFWCDGVEHISLCSCRDGGTGTTWPKHSERWRNFWRCTLWSLWWLNLGALLVHTPDNCHLFPQRILHLIFFSTRPKPAYGLQGLDWIVGPGYSFVVFSTNKTMETN